MDNNITPLQELARLIDQLAVFLRVVTCDGKGWQM